MGFYDIILRGSKEITVLLAKPLVHSELSRLIQKNHIISYHQELPMSAEQKKNGIYLCQNKSCLPKISSINELLEALDY
jgi:uncharacterized protein YyaL (SSP411 family)